MPETTLAAETGRTLGSRSSKRLRAAGKIPAVLYGHGIEPISLAVDGRELRHALHGDAGANTLLRLDFDGQSHLALARVLQKHPVRNTVVHVDFQVVSRDEVMHVDVPVNLAGEATEVKRGDGVVDQVMFSLQVSCDPTHIPNSIEVDISGMRVGDVIRVGDLKLPTGVGTDIDPEEPIAIAQGASATAMAEDLEIAEAAEAAEASAEAGEGDGGDAADASGDEG